MGTAASNLERLRREIESIARGYGRDPREIRIVAISKTFSPLRIEEAARAGQLLFGENRVQEAEQKIPDVRHPGLEWHLVGHLQSNKARRAVELFDVIQSLDSEKIAAKVAYQAEIQGKRMRVLIQVNVGEEPQKHGLAPRNLPGLVERVESFPMLQLEGLMAIPPHHDDPAAVRPYFRRLRGLLEAVNRERDVPLRELSMGMSGDYPYAIEEGATLLRIGTAIFGERAP